VYIKAAIVAYSLFLILHLKPRTVGLDN
jgi:hypothetical protein